MNQPAQFTLPLAACAAIAADVTHYGATQRVETGGFLLMPRGTSDVGVVAVAGSRGIVRAPLYLHLSGAAVEMISEWADDNDHRIVGQFHSHLRDAFLSDIDRCSGFCVDGFVSAVIPNFTSLMADSATWGWWRYGSRDWQPIEPPNTTMSPVTVITFDEFSIK